MKKKIVLSLCVLALLVNLCFAQSNLIPNASVEEGVDAPTYWNKSVSGAFWSNIGHEGIHNLLLNVSDANADWRCDVFNVSANAPYTFGFWVKGNVVSGGFHVYVRYFEDYAGTVFIEQKVFQIDGDHETWTQINQTSTSPSNAKSCDIFFHAETGNGQVYTDSYFMVEIEEEIPYWKQLFTEFLFGSGSLLGLTVLLVFIVLIIAKWKYAGILFIPITVLMAIEYFKLDLGWHGVLMLLTTVFILIRLTMDSKD